MVLPSSVITPEIARQEHWVGNLLFIGNYVYGEEYDSDAGHLLFGGLLLGDTFHTIPLLNWLTEERRRRKIIWWSGTYERPAVEFLERFYPIEPRYFKDGVPTEIEDRDRFIDARLPRLRRILKRRACATVNFDSRTNRNFALRNNENLQATPGNFMVIHPASRHSWKNIPAIHTLDWQQFGLPVISVGASGENLIPGSLDFRGRPFADVAQAIASSRLTVGIHSSISCLSLYLNRPMIVCAPDDDAAYVRFGALRSQIVDLIQPGKRELAETVNQVLEGANAGGTELVSDSSQWGQFGQRFQGKIGIDFPSRPWEFRNGRWLFFKNLSMRIKSLWG
jgi:hypothetical protein